jgi:hypothetical protein
MTRARRSIAAVLCTGLLAPGAAAAADAAKCNGEPIVTRQIRCFIDAAEAAGAPAICEAATDRAVRFNCLNLYAEHTLDTAPCDQIDAGSATDEARTLRQSCVAGVAVKAADPRICQTVTHPALRDSCYTMIVTEAGGDPALCGRVVSEVLRRSCQEAAAKRK